MPDPKTVRKTIEAGAGVVLIGVLEYIAQAPDIAAGLEQLLPAPLVPLVPVLLGGIALTVRVWRYANAPASEPAPNLNGPAPEQSLLATAPEPVSAAPVLDTPPASQDDAPGAADATAAPEPVDPPTSFIPLPTR